MRSGERGGFDGAGDGLHNVVLLQARGSGADDVDVVDTSKREECPSLPRRRTIKIVYIMYICSNEWQMMW